MICPRATHEGNKSHNHELKADKRLIQNSSYVSGVSVCIFVTLYVRMFVARANKVEGTMS